MTHNSRTSYLHLVLLLVAGVSASVPVVAQVSPGAVSGQAAAPMVTSAPPAFARYPASVERNVVQQPRLEGKAANFKTILSQALRDAAASGPNFGGRFVVATWGCGSGCVRVAFIDGRTGAVHFPPQLEGATPGNGELNNREMLEYRADSNLLIVNGTPATDDRYGVWAYKWTGQTLEPISYTVKKSSMTQ